MIKPNTWHEKASGNRIAVTADNAHIVVDKEATVTSMSFDKKGSNVSVQVDGHVESMRTTKENTVDVTANGKVDTFKIGAPATVSLKGSTKDAINVTVAKRGEGSDVTSSVKVNVETPVTLALHLQEGAEGSSVNVTEKDANVSVENKTSEAVKVTTPDGEKSVGAGETSTSQETQPSNPGTSTPGGGSNPSTSGDYVQVLDKVTVIPSTTSANIGDTVTFTVKAYDEFNDQIDLTEKNINWTVSGSSIKVVSGTSLIVTTQQVGTLEVKATVTVNATSKDDVTTVTVKPKDSTVTLKALRTNADVVSGSSIITGSGLTITSGSSVKFTVTGIGSDNKEYILNNEDIEWKITTGASIIVRTQKEGNSFTVETKETGTFTVEVVVKVDDSTFLTYEWDVDVE